MLAGERISALRREKGLSSAELGAHLHVSQGTISRYENGYVRQIPYDKLEQMGELFQCSVSDIIGNDPAYHAYSVEQMYEKKTVEQTAEDIELLEWYHRLSTEQQAVLRRVFKTPQASATLIVQI